MFKPKLIVFDINHTLIEDDSWLNLNLALGMTEQEDSVLWSLNQEGILPNALWVKIVNNLYRSRGKATRANIEAAVLNYTWLPGAKEVVTELKTQGFKLALLSGGMDVMVEHVAKVLDIDLFGYGSSLNFDAHGNLKEMIYLAEDFEMKRILLEGFCRRLDIDPADVVCVGDGANEAELFKMSKGVTFKGSKLESSAWKVVDNLSEIPELLQSA